VDREISETSEFANTIRLYGDMASSEAEISERRVTLY